MPSCEATSTLPFGIARSAAVESLVEQADELVDDPLAVQARLHLMTAYSYGGEPLKRFPVFSWLLSPVRPRARAVRQRRPSTACCGCSSG